MASNIERGLSDLSLSGLAATTLKRSGGIVLLVLGLLMVTALLGFEPDDPSLTNVTTGPIQNPVGAVGATLADLLFQTMGLASGLLAVVCVWWGGRLAFGQQLPWPWAPVIALPIALLGISAFLAAQTIPETQGWPYRVGLGGFLGDFQLFRLQPSLGAEGYFWGSFAIGFGAGIVAIGFSWAELVWGLKQVWRVIRLLLARLKTGLGWLAGTSMPWLSGLFARGSEPELKTKPATRREAKTRPAAVKDTKPAASEEAASPEPTETSGEPGRGRGWLGMFKRNKADGDAEGGDQQAGKVRLRRVRTNMPDEADTADAPAPDESKRVRRPKTKPVDERQTSLELDTFKLPALDLLAQSKGRPSTAPSPARLQEMSAELETVLDDFGVRGQIVDAKPGPVVTMFELEPAPGTRAARVISLADDIARSLCAMSVRVAVVPGRNVIGIELPNEKRETVVLRALLESETFDGSQARLALALGKDISGNPIIVDLARMPHLLIAGTTGSGKSVAINAMILSLLYRLTPQECRIIMIDPKVIELSVYEDIPHLLAPVVTEPHKAVVALKWVVRQMDERYRLMSHLGVRDIFAYNRRLEQARARGEELNRRVRTGFEPGTGAPIYEEIPIDMAPLPLIVVIVDEVADLMLTAGKEIEGAIQRLSQKARAAGVHLIVATQRPSVDVLTGVIKANLPSRISFRVSSKIDSRTILGEPGAEQLLGQGDMLYLMPGDRISRIHGPLVTDDEVEGVVAHLKAQGFPDYHDEITNEGAVDGGFDESLPIETGGKDDLYSQAVQIVARDGKASTSYLQRKLSIGYNSAAKLIERMETEGLISSADHVGRRQVLMGKGGVDGDEPTDI